MTVDFNDYFWVSCCEIKTVVIYFKYINLIAYRERKTMGSMCFIIT